MNRQALEEVAREFLSRLLHYRLLHHEAAAGPEKAEDALTRGASQFAIGLQVCFRDQPTLGDQVVALLTDNSNGDEAHPDDPRALLAEVLLVRCHEAERRELYVAEVALDMNAVTGARGGAVELTPRLVGALLKSVGLPTHRLSRMGRGLTLDHPTRRRIH